MLSCESKLPVSCHTLDHRTLLLPPARVHNTLQCDIDVSANSTAAYATSMVRGSTKSLTIDLGFVLEGQSPFELPECLIGAMRIDHLDLTTAVALNTFKEVPFSS
jgi:hypothetical protein